MVAFQIARAHFQLYLLFVKPNAMSGKTMKEATFVTTNSDVISTRHSESFLIGTYSVFGLMYSVIKVNFSCIVSDFRADNWFLACCSGLVSCHSAKGKLHFEQEEEEESREARECKVYTFLDERSCSKVETRGQWMMVPDLNLHRNSWVYFCS